MYHPTDSTSRGELRRRVAHIAVLVSLITLGACTTMPTGPAQSQLNGAGTIPAGDEAWLYKY